jgi:predicted acyltransferase
MSTMLEASPRPLAAAPFIESPAGVSAPTAPRARRLVSLDVFRGITIAAMLLVNNPGRGGAYGPLRHAPWDGWTVTDLIFPFFLFIVGVAIPFSQARRTQETTLTPGQQLARIWSRSLSLVLLGILVGASNLVWPFGDAPDGFTGSAAMRIAGFIFVFASILLLLTPWPWRSVSTWMPIGIGVLLLVYLVTMHFIRTNAVANGWPADRFGNGGAFNPAFLRIPGVLQRIGLCYGVAASLMLLVRNGGGRLVVSIVLAAIVLLCSGYALLMFYGRLPGADPSTVGSLTAESNFARQVDELVFDRKAFDGDKPIINPDSSPVYRQRHTYAAYPDPEGLISTLPAIATTLIGALVGFWLRSKRTDAEHAAALLVGGLGVVLLGLLLDRWLMPINKSLWTPSFAVFAAGMGMLVLGVVHWITEACGRRAWAWPFKVIGMNAIAAFVLAVIFVRISRLWLVTEPTSGKPVPALSYLNNRIVEGMQSTSAWWDGLSSLTGAFATPQNLSLAYALTFVLLVWLVTWVMYMCKVFVKV